MDYFAYANFTGCIIRFLRPEKESPYNNIYQQLNVCIWIEHVRLMDMERSKYNMVTTIRPSVKMPAVLI